MAAMIAREARVSLRRIEVRYIENRAQWKAVLLSGGQRVSVYGTTAADAAARLADLIHTPSAHWRRISLANLRVLYEENRGG